MTHQTYDLAVTTTDIMGADVEDVIVHAELIDFSDGADIMGSSFTDTMILPSVKSTSTDENGEATLSLVPTADLLPAAKYRILLTKGPRQFCYQISMPAGEHRPDDGDAGARRLNHRPKASPTRHRIGMNSTACRKARCSTDRAREVIFTRRCAHNRRSVFRRAAHPSGIRFSSNCPTTSTTGTDDLDLLVTWSGGSFRAPLLNSDLTNVMADELVPLAVVQAFRFYIKFGIRCPLGADRADRSYRLAGARRDEHAFRSGVRSKCLQARFRRTQPAFGKHRSINWHTNRHDARGGVVVGHERHIAGSHRHGSGLAFRRGSCGHRGHTRSEFRNGRPSDKGRQRRVRHRRRRAGKRHGH